MTERNFPKELEVARDYSRKLSGRIERMKNAVKIAARMDKPTEQEVNQLIYMAEGFDT